jgi:hypothetical protein
MRMRKSVAVLLLAVPLLAGCGGGSADRKAMEVKFEKLDYQISTLELSTAATYNQPHFAAATQRYIALVHKYADLLGPEEAKRRLNEASDGIAPYCLPCAGVLTEEAKRF